MEAASPKQKFSGMIPVARFYSAEEAEEFSQMASDAGILAVIADMTRGPVQFDGSLGGFTASEGCTVYVNPNDVPALCRVLEETLTVDPMDPLCALSNAELRAILDRPLKTNLTEWALAKKLLSTRGPDEDRQRTPQEKADWAQDAHAAADLRLARWLGGVVMISFLVGTALAAFGLAGGFAESDAERRIRLGAAEAALRSPSAADRLAEAIKLTMLPLVLTLSSTIVLIAAWRTLHNGTWRWMFPRVWRLVGWWTLILTVGGMLLGFILNRFRN